jgi:hypothetical protein
MGGKSSKSKNDTKNARNSKIGGSSNGTQPAKKDLPKYVCKESGRSLLCDSTKQNTC